MLDARRAAIRLAWLLGSVLIVAVLVVTTWMALVAAGVVIMLGQGASWATALIVAGVLNLVGAGALVCWMLALIKEMPFTALLRQLRGQPPEEAAMIPPDRGDLRSRAAHRRAPRQLHGDATRDAASARCSALASPAGAGRRRRARLSRRRRLTRRKNKPEHPERRKSDHIKAAKATGVAGLLMTARDVVHPRAVRLAGAACAVAAEEIPESRKPSPEATPGARRVLIGRTVAIRAISQRAPGR